MNKAYREGYLLENKVKKYLESFGYIVFRQAKSSFPDLIAITQGGRILLIECKVNGRISKKELERAYELHCKTGATFVLAYNDGGKIGLEVIYEQKRPYV